MEITYISIQDRIEIPFNGIIGIEFEQPRTLEIAHESQST